MIGRKTSPNPKPRPFPKLLAKSIMTMKAMMMLTRGMK
jgi:hypothetical protein